YGRAPEAVTLLEEARLAPRVDPLLERTLGDRLADLGRWEEAIAAYDRYLVRSPADPAVLRRLGDVHHAAGHPERVLEVGLQLLQLTRGLPSTRAWFEDKRLFEAWVQARCEQVAAQPRSTAVLDLLVELAHLDSPPLPLLQLLAQLERGARRDGVAPAGRPPLFWADALRHHELRLIAADPDLGRRRLSDLREALDREALDGGAGGDLTDGRTAADLAWICSQSPALHPGEEARLARALARWPGSLLLSADLARALSAAGRDAAAAVQWERLERLLSTRELLSTEEFRAQAREERARLRAERALALRVPRAGQERLEAVLLDLEAGLMRGQRAPGSLPLDLAQVRRERAVCLARAGERVASEVLLSHAASEHGEDLEACFLDAVACLSSSQFTVAETNVRVLDRALRRIGESDAGAQILRRWKTDQRLWSALGESYRSVGATARAYDLLRDLDRPEQARQVVNSRETYAQCVALFEQRLAAAEERIAGRSASSAAWWSAARDLHDAGVKLVELHEWTQDVSAADGVTTRLAANFPDDPTVLALAALFAERGGDRVRALGLHRRALAALEAPAGWSRQPVDWIRPRVPTWEPNARRAATWHALALDAESGDPPPTLAVRLTVLRLELEGQQLDVARATLERLVDEVGPKTAVFVRSLQHVLHGYELGRGASGFFAQLTRLAPGNLQVLRDFVGALWDEQRLEQAGTALEAFASANPALAREQAVDLERLRTHTRQLLQARQAR
ncbi:MAG: tetratricopeptide repeat protein, partial [Planctomycetota bacterium]